ncbi:MAG: SDR family NAD(P)-dependent oxidoreductase [Gammaproteobacteria bacterium]|nr:SDR family NAD(P)-dependent oxidoreductase [Gammaproteobacteria bacterium]
MSRALITGASAGLGSEFARQLAARGKDLVLVARRAEPMEHLARELREAHGVEVDVLTADMSIHGAPADLHAEARQRGFEIDFLVNNAGSEGPDLIRTRDWDIQDAYLRLMMTSVAAMCHEFMPAMIERGYGRVLNVASVAGRMTVGGDYSYGPTKAYLIALSKALASAYKSQGVHVMALCPGFTHTDFHASDKLTIMKSNTPRFAWYDADVVIREGLAALEQGKDEYTSGRLYRFLVPVLRQRWSRRLLTMLGVKL